MSAPASPARQALTGLAGAAAVIAVVTVLSRVLGFGRWLVQSSTVGYATIGDAYSSANTLPNVLFEVAAGGALAGALIPLISGPLARNLRGDVDRIASAMLGWALLVLVPLAVVLVLLAEPIATLLTLRDGPGPERDLVRWFLLVFAPQVPLYGVGVVLVGVLQAHRRFFWPALAPVFSSVVVIGSYAAFGVLSGGRVDDPTAVPVAALAWLGWGTTAGVAAMSLPLLVPLRRTGVRLRPTLRFPPGVAVRARSLAAAGIGALLAQQVAVLAVLGLSRASGGEGAYPVFLYTQAVYYLPYAVLAVPLATSTFPRLAARASTGDLTGYARLAALTTRAVLVVAAAGAAALAAAAPAVGELFRSIGRGDPALAVAMGPALTWMAPGLLGYALVFHVSRALYALERGRPAVLATAAGWLTVVVASGVLCWSLVAEVPDGPTTLLALGAGNTVGMTLAGTALLEALRRAAGSHALTGLPRTVTVLVVAATVAAVVGRRVTDAVAAAAGPGVPAAIGSGAAGAVLAAVLVVVATGMLDAGTVRGLRYADRDGAHHDDVAGDAGGTSTDHRTSTDHQRSEG
ncbi:lipid II flippase MurJ [Cellulomonas sp. ATA003]|uniref:murein biosynthesis integral membrane protein MurJ n=1 Tax=Cellulomonas sp. ATA003 TaxID=3073064 RepID=UPI002872E478|nr:lipid II flippase MurJ [Cellulomonas sp. ATA003]WNB86797.1 lipid II flippase MurJ [Cellulomonas sp. ATA003]